MTFTPYAKEVKAILAILDSDEHESGEGMAAAILAEAWRQFTTNRGKYTVVGQLTYQPDRRGKDAVEKSLMEREERPSPYVGPGDPRMAHVNLGWYTTQKQAEAAASSLHYSSQSGEEWRAMILPVFHGTASEWHKSRKDGA